VVDLTIKRKITVGSKGYATVYLDDDLIKSCDIEKGDKVLVTRKICEGLKGIFIYKK
jgi:hypothetical protein